MPQLNAKEKSKARRRIEGHDHVPLWHSDERAFLKRRSFYFLHFIGWRTSRDPQTQILASGRKGKE